MDRQTFIHKAGGVFRSHKGWSWLTSRVEKSGFTWQFYQKYHPNSQTVWPIPDSPAPPQQKPQHRAHHPVFCFKVQTQGVNVSRRKPESVQLDAFSSTLKSASELIQLRPR